MKFPIVGKENEFFLIFTTTPWTVPADTAIAVNENLDYVKVRQGSEYYWIAELRMDELKGEYKIIKKAIENIEETIIKIEIKGITQSLCETITVEQKSSSEKVTSNIGQSSKEIEQENYAQPLTSSVIYQSSDLKAKNIGIYFFCATLLLLIIYLIFKKSL